MRAARHVIDEERLIRRQRIDLVHVGDGLVRHRGGEVVTGVALERIDVGGVAGEVRRLPLVGVAAHEAVEVLEAHADRPLVEGADGARLEGRRVVVLAEPRGAVAVVLQDLADGGLVFGDDAVVAGVARRLLGDHAEARRMMVAAGDEGRPGGRAQRRGVEVGVAQTHLGDAVQSRGGDDAAEGAGRAEAHVVGHDQQHVGRALGRHHPGRPPGLRTCRRALDLAAELRRRRRQLLAADGGGGAGRTRHPGGLAGPTALVQTVALRHALGLGDLPPMELPKAACGRRPIIKWIPSGLPALLSFSRSLGSLVRNGLPFLP